MHEDVALSLPVNAVNDVSGPDDITPSLLVFGTLAPTYTPHDPQQKKGDQLQQQALQREVVVAMEGEMANAKINRALKYAISPATNSVLCPGEKVLVWGENIISNNIGEWL